jgi:hypothetical protein
MWRLIMATMAMMDWVRGLHMNVCFIKIIMTFIKKKKK